MTLPEGYSYQILAPWGEVINEAGDEVGFNHDFVGFFPIDMLEGDARARRVSSPSIRSTQTLSLSAATPRTPPRPLRLKRR